MPQVPADALQLAKPVCGWEIYLILANIVIQMDIIAPGAS
jgi:hypothetical protein